MDSTSIVFLLSELRLTLLTGESAIQWHKAKILWAPSDWSPLILGRYWAKVSLSLFLENMTRCRLYRSLVEQWEKELLSRLKLSEGIRLPERPVSGGSGPRRKRARLEK